jgi:hypothetical protein
VFLEKNAFVTILFEIPVGYFSTLPGGANSEGTANLEIPKFVSDTI